MHVLLGHLGVFEPTLEELSTFISDLLLLGAKLPRELLFDAHPHSSLQVFEKDLCCAFSHLLILLEQICTSQYLHTIVLGILLQLILVLLLALIDRKECLQVALFALDP